ncbi:MAG: flagellar hook capping protein [Lachnospiraceae bacterium]|nr:flagellar hook capping protein [Lachnospiraceae bacterium]
MADNNIPVSSGTSNPYVQQYYTVEANDKNTLTMTDYFKLLAAQLANQDMTNPMENSEMMNQMVQMGMMQAITAMTDSMEASMATTAQTYAASLIGQEVTVMVTEESASGVETPTGVKYGKVEYVSFVNGDAKFKLEGDKKEYSMSYLVGVGKIPDPFVTDVEIEGDKDDEKDPVEGTEGTEGTEGAGGTTEEKPGETTEGTGNTTDVPGEAGTGAAGSTGTEANGGEAGEPTEGAQEGAAAAAGVTQ